MELRKFYGNSGQTYFVTWSKETNWNAFIFLREGDCFVPVVAKEAAIDCGAVGDRKQNTHQYWQQIWSKLPKTA
jgi:hypothetical protein